MTKLKCDCGKFEAELVNFPKNSPGRCVCYCDDCQTYLHYLGRPELLDAHGGSEITPVYPADFKIVTGKNHLACVRLSPRGLFRFYVSCCNTPLGNNLPKFPWLGTLDRMYAHDDPNYLEKTAGPIKCRILGKFAIGTPPKGTSQKNSFKDLKVIFPFLLKGFLTGKAKNSELYMNDGVTPIVKPKILTLQERNQIREKMGLAPF